MQRPLASSTPAALASPRIPRLLRRAELLAWWAGFFLLAVVLDWWRGAFASGFGAYDDEAAHAVSALMIHDWLVGGQWGDPLGFAKDYYLHYPKVAIGQWPPVFHTLLALWTVLFGASRVTLVLFSSAVTAVLAVAVQGILRRELSRPLAAATAGILLLTPLVQRFGSAVMTETLLALFCFLALVCFAKLLERGRLRDGLCFGLCAVLAILTKGNGLALGLVPPLAIVLSRRWRLVRNPALWVSAVLVILLCGPWYYFTVGIVRGSWGGGASPNFDYAGRALLHYAAELPRTCGWTLSILALIGLVARTGRGETNALWDVAAAWILAWFVLHLVLPTSIEARHLITLLPVWLMFAAAGAHWLASRLHQDPIRHGVAVASTLLVLFGVEVLELPRKDFTGFDRAASWLLGEERLANGVFLIESDQIGEGLLVSEVALREERPGHYVLRGTKVLCRSDWIGREYRSFFATTEELAARLREIPVAVVCFDRSCEDEWLPPHHALLDELLRADPGWQRIGCYDVTRGDRVLAGGLELWEQTGIDLRLTPELDFDSVSGHSEFGDPR